MKISPDARNILNKYKEAINNGDFESIYNDRLVFFQPMLASEISQIFLNSGINPLNYLNKVPDAFLIGADIDQIEIPDGIIEIRSSAFNNCTNLTKIEIPNSVDKIDVYTFYNCTNLKYIKFSKNIETIPRGVCAGCVSLEFVYLPDKLKFLKENAFNGCSKLQTIVLPEGIEDIEGSAFPGTLKHVYYEGIKEQWKKVNVDFDNPFFKDVNPTIVHCNDGDLVVKNIAGNLEWVEI